VSPAEAPRALVLGGPTASGKTAAALAVAEAWGAVVLSADAMQVYRGMDVGTAKATPDERARVEHFGVDVRDPYEAFDAADFVALADEVLVARPRVVVAGGTSLYLQALQRGLVETPRPDPVRRAELLADPGLYARLQEVDPELAARLHPRDLVRVVRGVEVFEATGERLSALQAAHARAPDRVTVEAVWLDAPDLEARIDARVLRMVEEGYVEEVRVLLDAGVDRALKPMRSLGYRHLADHLIDGVPLDEAVRRTQRDTRRFAHKQRTWHNALRYPRAGDDPTSAALAAARRLWGDRAPRVG
jgi:tRNA dimethylallyltransferase